MGSAFGKSHYFTGQGLDFASGDAESNAAAHRTCETAADEAL